MLLKNLMEQMNEMMYGMLPVIFILEAYEYEWSVSVSWSEILISILLGNIKGNKNRHLNNQWNSNSMVKGKK